MLRKALPITVLALALLVPAAPAGSGAQSSIPLPEEFRPEGIASGKGDRFYVGSIPLGAVYSGSYRTGEGAVLVPPHPGPQPHRAQGGHALRPAVRLGWGVEGHLRIRRAHGRGRRELPAARRRLRQRRRPHPQRRLLHGLARAAALPGGHPSQRRADAAAARSPTPATCSSRPASTSTASTRSAAAAGSSSCRATPASSSASTAAPA